MFSLAGAFGAIPYVATVVVVGYLWNTLIENPALVREARAGFASTVELEAMKAQLNERERQAQVALEAGNKFADVLRAQATALATEAAEQEKKDDEYAAKLKKAGRACLLTDADIRELRK